MNEEALNLSIRRFLKTVGVSSQRAIEHAVADASAAGAIAGVKAPQTDWATGLRGCIIWGISAAVLIVSPVRYFVVAWPAVLTFMGLACLANARRCGRVHCYVTGPFFLLLALVGLLYGLGVMRLGARGWSILSIGLVVGSVVLIFVSESLFGRYRASAIRDRGGDSPASSRQLI